MAELPDGVENHDGSGTDLQEGHWREKQNAQAGQRAGEGAQEQREEGPPADVFQVENRRAHGNNEHHEAGGRNEKLGGHGRGGDGKGQHGRAHTTETVDEACHKPGKGEYPDRRIKCHGVPPVSERAYNKTGRPKREERPVSVQIQERRRTDWLVSADKAERNLREVGDDQEHEEHEAYHREHALRKIGELAA